MELIRSFVGLNPELWDTLESQNCAKEAQSANPCTKWEFPFHILDKRASDLTRMGRNSLLPSPAIFT